MKTLSPMTFAIVGPLMVIAPTVDPLYSCGKSVPFTMPNFAFICAHCH